MLLFSPVVQTLFFSFTGEGDDKIQEESSPHRIHFFVLYFYLAFRFSVPEMRVIKVPFQAAAQAVFILYELKFCTVHQMQF